MPNTIINDNLKKPSKVKSDKTYNDLVKKFNNLTEEIQKLSSSLEKLENDRDKITYEIQEVLKKN